jgi:hypothetical protein
MIKCVYCKEIFSPPTTAAAKSQYLAHLRVAHKSIRPTETQINDFTELHDIHICPTCPLLQPYNTHTNLAKHNNTRHLILRTKTNLEFVTDTYRSADKDTWGQALNFLNHLHIEPPPFRSSIYRHTQALTKTDLFNTYHNLNKWILLASTPLDPNHQHVDPVNNTSDPFWKLLFIFEALILFPPTKEQKVTSYSRLVQARLRQFRKGNIITLYEEAFDIDKYKAPPTTHPSFDNKTTISHSAQVAADADNYGVASQRIQSCMPTVTITDQISEELKSLYPARISFPSSTSEHIYPEHPQHTTRPPIRNPTTTIKPYPIDRDCTIRALRNIKKGTAPGPFTHSTDFIRAYALTKNKRQNDNTYIYLDTFIKILNITTNNQLSPTTTLNFGSQYFTALYKDTNNLKKKRPISIGTALRRVNSAILLEHHRNDIARLYAPDGQYGIAVKGGLEFIVHKAQAQYHLFIDTPNQHKQPVSRVLLLLDITNMFNEISRDACRLLLSSTPELQDMVPYFDQICKEPNRCWYKTDTGTYRHFKQCEGFAQGCPLSGSFAGIVLSILLRKINKELISRHQLSDIPAPHTSSFIDDTNLFLTLQDVEWFIHRFNELGRPLGIKLNQQKTQLLTGPTTYFSSEQNDILERISTILQPSNILTDGCKLLGHAIGTKTFINAYMQEQATKYRTTVSRITTRLLDRQTMSSIYRYCAQPAIAHLIGSDILNTYNQNGNPPIGDPTKWTTPFLDAIETTDSFFLRFITDTNTDHLPSHATLIATIPTKTGGLGYRHHKRGALSSFAVPIARTINYALNGLQIGSDPDIRTHLAADHRYAFEILTASTAPNNPWQHIDTLAHTIDTCITKDATTTTPYANISKPQTQRRFYQTMTTAELTAQIPLFPKDISVFLPSLLSPLTSIALHNLPRSEPSNRLNNESFTLLLQRKLRLAILHEPGKCICGTTFDIYGDHAFGCRRTSKTVLHDAITKTLAITLRPLLTLTNRTNTAYDTVIEPTGLIPDAPAKRPADIMIRLSPPTKQTNQPIAKLQLLDITIPHPPSLTVPQHGLNERLINPENLALFADRSHLASMKDKYQGKTTSSATQTETIATITERNYALIPFTIDHLGRLGYSAHEFLGMPTTPFPPTKPPWNKTTDLSRTNEFAYKAYTFANKSPQHLLHGVNAIWRELSSDPYGDTYHTATPSIWFQQTVSLNISIALARHLINARNRLTNNDKQIDNDIHGTPYPFPQTRFHGFQRNCF